MNDKPAKELSPFADYVTTLTHRSGLARDKAIWNAALEWASEHAYLEVIDEFTGKITEAKLESMDLMDEIYQVSKTSILQGIEGD